jgi:hypothetical protein
VQYYTTSSLAEKKGEFSLDQHSFVSHNSNMDKREFVFCLHAKGQNRQELLLSAPDFSSLSAWETAINDAVATLKRRAAELDSQRSFDAGRCSTRLTKRSSKSGRGGEDRVLKSGKLEKCGQRMKTWTTRWFLLTDKRITYYSDARYSNQKGERVLDVYSSVKQKPAEGNRTHLFALYTGLAEVELLMSAPSSDAMSTWIDSITEAIGSASTVATYMSVNVSVCTAYSKQVAEPIYKICVQTYRGFLVEYYHFADIRDIYNQIISLAPSLKFNHKFPPSYKKSSFGGATRLTVELLEDRRKNLERWLQEVFDSFAGFGLALPMEDSDDEAEVEFDDSGRKLDSDDDNDDDDDDDDDEESDGKTRGSNKYVRKVIEVAMN